jgi:hypothetical protein
VVEVSRPLAVSVSVALFGVYWIAAVGYTTVTSLNQGTLGLENGAFAAGSTLVVAAILAAVWRGGPTATRSMARFGLAVGPVLVVGMFALGSIVSDAGFDVPLRLLLPGVVGGLVLTVAGLLLRRRDVREWAATREPSGVGKVVGLGLAVVIGAVSLVSAFTGDVRGGTGTRVTAGIIGGVLLLLGALPLAALLIVTMRRRGEPD